MYTGERLFSQIMDFLPWKSFHDDKAFAKPTTLPIRI